MLFRSRQAGMSTKLAGTMPQALTEMLANLNYFEKSVLPQALANSTSLRNPDFDR